MEYGYRNGFLLAYQDTSLNRAGYLNGEIGFFGLGLNFVIEQFFLTENHS